VAQGEEGLRVVKHFRVCSIYPSAGQPSSLWFIECRKLLGCEDCSLFISGTEDEVLDLAVLHAIVSHGRDDPYELRQQFKGLLEASATA